MPCTEFRLAMGMLRLLFPLISSSTEAVPEPRKVAPVRIVMDLLKFIFLFGVPGPTAGSETLAR